MLNKKIKISLSIIIFIILFILVYYGIRKTSYEIFFNMGSKLEVKGDIVGAIKSLEKAANLAWSQSSIYATIGDVGIREHDAILVNKKESKLGKEGTLDVSVFNFMKSLEYNPQNPWAWSGLSEYFERKSYIVERLDVINISKLQFGDLGKLDYEDWMAIATVKKALELEPNNHFYHDLLGFIYQENELREKAMAKYEKSIELVPDINKHFFIPIGEMPEDMKEAITNGMSNAFRANEILPTELLHRNFGKFLKMNRYFEKALHHYKQALELSDTKKVKSWNLLEIADSNFHLKKYDDALTAIKESIANKSDNEHAFFLLGRIYEEKGNEEKALENYKKAILLNPKHYWFLFVYAEQSFNAKNYKEAENYYLKAIQLMPNKSNAYVELIELYMTIGLEEKAKEFQKKLYELEKDLER